MNNDDEDAPHAASEQLGEHDEDMPDATNTRQREVKLDAQVLKGLNPVRRRRQSSAGTGPSGVKKPRARSSQRVAFRGYAFKNSLLYSRSKRVANDPNVKRAVSQKLKGLVANLVRYDETREERLLPTIRQALAELPLDARINEATLIDSGFMTDSGARKFMFETRWRDFPADIVDDFQAMVIKWDRGDYDHSIMRGIRLDKTVNDDGTGKGSAYSVEPTYEYKVAGNVVDANHLQHGQWWPYQICAFRDGAVGMPQAGVTANSDFGAVAVVVSADQYKDDEDHGIDLWYSGTKQENLSKSGDITAATAALDKAYRMGTRVRVLRSSAKNKAATKWRPVTGIRYDGLYRIDDKKEVDPETQLWAFHMVRCEDQPPMRNEGVAARPTNEEIKAFEDYKINKKMYS